jgi:hypothetical protein
MKQKILSILLFAISINSFSQPVIGKQKTIGGNAVDLLGGLWPTSDGGMILGGRSFSTISGEKTETNNGVDDYWVVKLDKSGSMQWQRTLGGTDVDEILALQQTKDGGYILAGNSLSSPSGDKAENKGVFDFWVIKLNSFGSVEWQKALGGDSYEFCNSVQQTKDGGYLIGGSSVSNISGDKTENSKGGYDFWIVKLSSSGIKLWDKTIGGSSDEFLNHVIETTDGGYFLGGISTSNISGDKSENTRGFNDFWAVKLDANRNKQWDKTAGGTDNDYTNGLVQTPDSGYILGGASASNISGEKTENSRGGFDFWVVKLNKNGKVQFDKTMGGSADEYGQNVENTSDGGIIICGGSQSNISGEKTENSRGGQDYWVIKLNNNGAIQWDKTIGGDGDDNLLSVKEVQKDKYLLGGYSTSNISGDKTENSRGEDDYWVVNLNYKPVMAAAAAAPGDIAVQQKNINGNIFNAYPNPAKDVLNIRVNGKAIISLSDISGKIIRTKTIDGSDVINVADIPAGAYYLKDNTTGITKKIMIIK